jgi:hypothetical protein
MDLFLEEQLKRIQDLTKKMTGWEQRSAELSQEIERDREAMRRDPLHDVRDLRTVSQSDRFERAHTADAPRRRRKRQ